MIGTLLIVLQQIHEGAELQAGDVGPAATFLHPLEQGEQVVAICRQAAAERAVLDATVKLFQVPQQSQQALGITGELLRQRLDLGELILEVVVLLVVQTHDRPHGTLCSRIQVVESRAIVRGISEQHR